MPTRPYLLVHRIIIVVAIVAFCIFYSRSKDVLIIWSVLMLPGIISRYISPILRNETYKPRPDLRYTWAFELSRYIWNGFRGFRK